jgi:uroporphyrinogen-III decarboxylase
MAYELDLRQFWLENERSRNQGKKSKRIPVSIGLDGDWICEFLQLDNAKYYSDYEYQQKHRLEASVVTEREIGLAIKPAIDFGVIMDASIYGGKVNYRSNATPTLEPVVTSPEEIDDLVEKMEKVDLLEQGLVPTYLEWRERLKADYGIEVGYGWGIKGCATTLGQICSITNFLTWIMTEPAQIKKLVQCWVKTGIRYVKAMRAATVYPATNQGFSLASDVTGMLSPSLYDEFIMEAEREIFQTFAPEEDAVRYYHADFHMAHHLDSLREIGVNVVNVDPYIQVKDILAKMPDVTIHGQIPPLDVLLYGKPEDVIECIRRDIEQEGETGQLVVSTVGSICPGTSFENLRAIVHGVEKYGVRR